jgi:hypothetical protein
LDGSHFRLYDQATDPLPIQSGSANAGMDSPPTESPTEGADESGAASFAYQSDLRNFLSKNLHVLVHGLRLLDMKGTYVVIELKVSHGCDRAVGQLRRYMGWIAKNQHDPGQAVRGIIVAREISEDLVLACSGLSDVELFEYEMSVTVRRIER